MKSLFSKADAESFIDRINKVNVQTKPKWGKMNAAQMFAHCTEPLRMASGELEGKRGIIGFLFGKSAKKKFIRPGKSFDKNLPTDPDFIFPSSVNAEEQRKRLVAEIRKFNEKGKAGITSKPHSFFGKMSPEEWDIIQSKHLDHHLNQFGV